MREFGREPLDRPAEQQDAAGVRVLKRRHVGQFLLLRRLALERQHVVGKEGGLGSAHAGRDPRVRRIAGLDRRRVRPPRHREVEVGSERSDEQRGDQAGRAGEGLAKRHEEEGRGDQSGRQEAERERLDARDQSDGRGGGPDHRARALDGVAGGERAPVQRRRLGRPPEGQSQHERHGSERRGQDEQLPAERQEGPGHPAEQEAAGPNERDIGRKRERDGDQQPRHVRGRGDPPAGPPRRAGAAGEHPAGERHGVDELHAVEGDVQLAEQDDLAEDGQQADEEEDHGAVTSPEIPFLEHVGLEGGQLRARRASSRRPSRPSRTGCRASRRASSAPRSPPAGGTPPSGRPSAAARRRGRRRSRRARRPP